MNDLALKTSYELPANVGDLSKFVLIGREKLVAVKAEIRAIDKVGLAQEVRKQKIEEAQLLSEAVLDAEVRLGELMKELPKATPNNNPFHENDSSVDLVKPKAQAIKDAGFTPKQAERFQQLAEHKDLVERAKAEARENDDVVSRSLVLNMIKAEKKEHEKKERQEAISDQIGNPKSGQYVDILTTDKKYRVIYADPPWEYNDKQDTSKLGGAVKHYPTMPLDEICALPVRNLSEDNAVLFLWVTSPMLEDSFKVINAWGFNYKSSFVWDKISHVMGHYNSVRHEFLLVCVRGSCVPDIRKLFDSVVSIERTEHSKKPEQFREMIDTLYPIGERLEMFARTSSGSWDVWGNMAND